jgi:hypothetical protein
MPAAEAPARVRSDGPEKWIPVFRKPRDQQEHQPQKCEMVLQRLCDHKEEKFAF